MIEFDLERALTATYSGLGAAFVVLMFLILFTVAVRLLSRLRGHTVEASVATAVYTPSTASTPDSVPASVAAVTELQDSGPVMPGEEDFAIGIGNGSDVPEDAEPVDDWKIYGRLEAFSSRRVGRRGG